MVKRFHVYVLACSFLSLFSDGHEEETVVPLIEESIKEEKSEEKPNDQTVVEVTCCDVNDTRNSIAICTNQKQLIVKSVVFWSTFLQR